MSFWLYAFVLGCASIEKETQSGEVVADSDGDGFTADEDCDDSNPLVSPNAEEICDGIDNNCDDDIDEELGLTFYQDADGDGFGDDNLPVEACELYLGLSTIGGDCDNSDAMISPVGG